MASTHHLMIEGRDDWFVIKALLRADGGEVKETGSRSVHEVRWRSKRRLLEVSDHETEHGVSNLLSNLPVRLKQSDLERLAVVLDADTDLAARWQSLAYVLGAAGYSTPKCHLHPGRWRGYFVLDDLELGLSALHEFGGGPSIDEVSPSLRYVAQPLVGHWPVIPYVGVFYSHWFLGSGFSDLDTIGSRAGLLRLSGRVLIGLGVAYEHTVSSCARDCDSLSPDVTLGFTF